MRSNVKLGGLAAEDGDEGIRNERKYMLMKNQISRNKIFSRVEIKKSIPFSCRRIT